MQELKVKSQNGKRKRDAAGLLYSVFCILTTVFLFGCSASAPPQNPYSCPTDSSFTIPTYCKPGKDPLLNTSIGQSWPAPFTYYLYTENNTTKDTGISAALPKFYLLNPPSVVITEIQNTSPVGYLFGDTKIDNENLVLEIGKPELAQILVADKAGDQKTWFVKQPPISDRDVTGVERVPLIKVFVNGVEKPGTNFKVESLKKIIYTVDAADDALTADANVTATYYTRKAPASFSSDADLVLAEYDSTTTIPPSVTVGVFPFDPDGKIGSGLDVGMTFLATDSNNKEVGFFDSTTNLLLQGAGKKVKWTASVTGSQTTRVPDATYALTVNGFDEKNNTFSVQFKVQVKAKP